MGPRGDGRGNKVAERALLHPCSRAGNVILDPKCNGGVLQKCDSYIRRGAVLHVRIIQSGNPPMSALHVHVHEELAFGFFLLLKSGT